MTQRCEYLVVGTGAGGSVAGARLAEAGHDVLFLEEGGDPSPYQSTNVSEWMRHTYRNGGFLPMLGAPMVPLAEARCVGGGTVINGALIWRTPPWVLEEWHRGGLEGYGGGQLRPYFEVIERDLRVVEHKLSGDTDLDSLRLYHGARSLGWKAVTVPRAVKDVRNEEKQSALKNYLPRAAANGARIQHNARAVKIVHGGHRGRRVLARILDPDTNRTAVADVAFDHLVLAGGAVQTPHLLQRSGIIARRPYAVQFHLNLKIVAVFPDEINAHRGTIFTVQLQEFEREGILCMATYLTPHFFALTLARHGVDAVNAGLMQYHRSGLYTTMVRAKSTARVESRLGDQPLLTYRLDPDDLPVIQRALERSAQALFAGGACALYLPVRGTAPVTTMGEVHAALTRALPKLLDMATVHVMASCSMGSSAATSATRPDGRLWGFENILVTDASVLPSNIGESPQGTIMAFAHAIVDQHVCASGS